MKTHLASLAFACTISLCSLLALAAEPTEVSVDWTRSVGRVNRGLFSTQGFMQVYVESDPRVMQTFTLINPEQTHTRLEIYLHQMEPQNDNDDPNVFNWAAYRPNEMIRFIRDRSKFEAVALGKLGMEPLALLCYNVEWLKSDDERNIIRDVDEWVEFAAAVVESYNGKRGPNYKNNLKNVEVWNEPNFSNFHIGSMEAYSELFRKTAQRIHRDYPGVQVGGPAISHAPGGDPEAWMDHFFEHSAKYADFISYHHYGPGNEPVDRLINDVTTRAKRFRSIPGKENGKIQITEIDMWLHGWGKVQHILERQFRFLELDELISSVHHFCCMAYGEGGNYTFGVVRDQGSVLPGVFWPYWLFRNYIGEKAAIQIRGQEASDLRVAASHEQRDGTTLATVVLHNAGDKKVSVTLPLRFKAADRDRVLVLDVLTPRHKGPRTATRIPAGRSSWQTKVTLGKGEAATLTLQESGERFFAFRDINNQEHPWLSISSTRRELSPGESTELSVRMFNPNLDAVSGTIEVRGLVDGWSAELIRGNAVVRSLQFGQSQTCVFRVTAKGLATQPRFSPYAVLATPETRHVNNLDRVAHSIPTYVELKPPYQALMTPTTVYAVAGETNRIEIQIDNELNDTLRGKLTFEPPAGCKVVSAADRFEVAPKSQARFGLEFAVPVSAKPGMLPGKCFIEYKGTRRPMDYRIEIVEPFALAQPVTLDLTQHLNADAVCFGSNRNDFDTQTLGMFAYPADFTPSGRIARTRGIPFKMPSLSDGRKSVLTPRGQRVSVPADEYQGAVLLGYGHDGKHPGAWTLHYTDGSSQIAASEIPEWCSVPPTGALPAFNAPHRWIGGGPAAPDCQLWMWTLPIDGGKTLSAIEMPRMKNAHLFAITLLQSNGIQSQALTGESDPK